MQSSQSSRSVERQPRRLQPIKQVDAVTKMLEDQNQKDQADYQNIEKKRMQYIKNLSLAQRLGLVEKPSLPLSQTEWKDIEQQSLKRFNDKEPCPICYDDLRFQEQTILSCTHVFHKKCLDSFERFQRLKGHDKACPICRKEDYDQKTYAEGMKRYLIRCIVSMQALARGFLQRNKFYQGMKDKGYNPSNGAMRRRFIGYKLGRIGKRYMSMMNKEREEILGTIQRVDKSIKDTDKLLDSFMPNMARIWQERRERQKQEQALNEHKEDVFDKFWKPIRDKAATRQEKECPICYNSYKYHQNGEVYLLDCSHMFHKCCLESFERFDLGNNLCCPMCRHPSYQKKLIKGF
ncbi:hypothetical protein FGO68_gene17756 [Halteria grandinella]|uniref:RING-type domain-containing protein n=1 Tax=Halteria grandinella TaxID=5974 RepID=A0A8J8SUJ5_HALGN|nr:hypothetical protein FGO68_gene17756 [Halteria grandinella]